MVPSHLHYPRFTNETAKPQGEEVIASVGSPGGLAPVLRS